MSDFLYYCAKCNSLIADKYENDDVTCDDCWGRMTPLHITEDNWSNMSDSDKTALLDKYRNPQPQVQKKRPSSTNQHSNSKQRAKKISNSDRSYNTQEKDYYDRISGLSITSFVFSFFISIVGIILGIIDLTKNDGRKKGLSIAAISVGGAMFLITIVLSILSFSTNTLFFGKSEAVKNVEQEINAIGNVTLDSEEMISTAEKAYDALTEEEKLKVQNYSTLLEARQQVDSLGIKLTLDNYEKYLNVSCARKLTDGIDFGLAMGSNKIGSAVYRQIDYSLSVSGKSQNYDYNDVVVTAVITGYYVPYSQAVHKKINKREITNEDYFKSHMEPIAVELTADTDILGRGSDNKSYTIPNNEWVHDTSVSIGYEITDISGTMTPVR